MKKIYAILATVLVLSGSLVSCRSYNADDGMYGYYNGRSTDREYTERSSVPESTKKRIKDSYDSAKGKVKNAIDSTAEYLGDTFGGNKPETAK